MVGNTYTGQPGVMLKNEEDLIAGTPWYNKGFTVVPFLQPDTYNSFLLFITNYFKSLLADFGVQVPTNFKLEDYHLYVDDDLHIKVLTHMGRGMHTDLIAGYTHEITQCVSAACGIPLRIADFNVYPMFNIRIVRPNRFTDNNPPHKDVYIDRLKNAVNIYAPLAGSDAHSALPFVPGSHLWQEDTLELTHEGYTINGRAFFVTTVVSAHGQPLQMTRPNPAPNQAMVFTPYAIHGGGFNLNQNKSRFSLEIRFVKA